MSNEYIMDDKKAAEVKSARSETFADVRQSWVAVVSAVLVGLWVMFTMAPAYDHLVGINWFIFVVLAVTAVGVMMALDDNLNIPHAVFWLAVIVIIASTFFRMYDFPVLAFLFLPTAVVFFTIYAAKEPSKNVIARFFYRHFAFFIHFWNLFLVRFSREEDGKKGNGAKILWGIGISVLLLFIIVPLMLSADMMFENTIDKIFDFDFFDDFFSRLIIGILVTLLGFAFLYTVTVKKGEPRPHDNAGKRNADIGATVITVLSVLSFVFAVFIIIQIRFLIFKAGGVLPAGYTYTEYAVEGYWSQAALTALNLVVVLAAMVLSKGAQGRTKGAINALLTLMTALNAYLVLSAAYKMHLYENAYGFTDKRLLVYLILLFELITLVLLVYSIFKRDFPFIKTVVYLAAAYFAVVACLNLQAISVSQNIQRFEAGKDLDTKYLKYEASDASNQKKDFYIENYDQLSSEWKEDIEYDFSLYKSYNNNQYFTLEEYKERYQEGRSWYEFNLSDYRKYLAGREMLIFLQQQAK